VNFLRWFGGTTFIAVFLITTICDLVLVYRWHFHHERASLVLLVGGAAGFLGLLTLPIQTFSHWFWLPILADFCLPYCAGLFLFLAKKFVR